MHRVRDRMKAQPVKQEAELESASGCVFPPLLQVGEASRYLGVGRNVLYDLIESGDISVARDEGSILVEKKSLDAFRARGTLK